MTRMVQDNVHQIKAYHGTSLACANIIVRTKHFISSTGTKEWLGSGIYFFPHFGSAAKWASSKRVPSVVSVILRFNDSQFLDLDEPYNLRSFEKCFREYMDDVACEGELIPKFSKRNIGNLEKLWCVSSNIYKQENKNIKLMAYTFSMPYDTLTGFEYKQKQFCSTDNSIITDICREKL